MNQLYSVAITGFTNDKGDLFAYSETTVEAYQPLLKDEETLISTVEIFPYSTFSSLHRLGQPGLTPVIIQAEVELSPEEYRGLSSSGIIYHRFPRRMVRASRVIENPWQYARRVMEIESMSKSGGIRYEMTTWQSRQGFANENELQVYLDFHESIKDKRYSKLSITKQNYKWLPRFLEESMGIPLEMHEINSQRDPNYAVDKSLFYGEIEKLPVEKIAKFLSLTSIYQVENLDKSLHTKELFDHYLKFDARENVISIMDKIPDDVLVQYDPDSLFEKQYSDLQALIEQNGYEPYDDGECVYDDRDNELGEIGRILPLLTEKSVPLLRTLTLSYIAPYLSEDVLKALSEGEDLLPSSQIVKIIHEGIEISLSIEEGRVAAVYSDKYPDVTIVDRTSSDISVFNDKMKSAVKNRSAYLVYTSEEEEE